jgi:ferric-dicitrate binding protein FerR (iron transport regulator)
MKNSLKPIVAIFTYLLFSLAFVHAQSAKVTRLSGDVTSISKTSQASLKLRVGDEIKEGVSVTVKGSKSYIQLAVSDGSMILQRQGTLNFKIFKEKKTLLNLTKGKVFIYKNPKSDLKLNVRTKNVSFAVRGTKFYVEDGSSAYLCVCEGVVAARNKKGVINISAGEDLRSSSRSDYEKTTAKSNMMSMASEGFDFMGIPVVKP